MLDKLQSLPIETLFALKKQLDAACESRRYELFKVGREATFPTNKVNSGVCHIRITGLGPKNVSGYRIDEQGNHLMKEKWRVSPNLLTPIFDKPKVAQPLRTAGDMPTNAAAGSF